MTYLLPTPVTATGCRVTHSVDQAIPIGILTTLAFDTDTFDVGGMHDTAVNNSRITIPVGADGVYILGAGAHFGGAAGVSTRSLGILLNGGNYIVQQLNWAQVVGAFDFSLVVSCSWNLVAGDFLEVDVFQNAIAGLNITTAADSSPIFWAQRQTT
jgi:hypothetical protein